MNRTRLLELVANPENSRIEFKRDDCRPERLAREMSALLNLEGGFILLGVESDGRLSGLTRSTAAAEEWVMNIARENLQPAVIPVWMSVDMGDGKTIGVVELPADEPGKPYKARRGNAWVTNVRVGSTSREATRDEEARLYQAARMIRYELKGVPGTGLEALDLERVENYFCTVLKRTVPSPSDRDGWRRLLLNTDLLVPSRGADAASAAALLLFGRNPNRHLPQAGVTAAAFPGAAKEYNVVDEERIRGSLVSMVSREGSPLGDGVIDRTVAFVNRNVGSVAWLEGARRRRKQHLPISAVREAVVNAVAHRDYAREGTDVEVSLYQDRLEVISPGCLPNGVTVEKMREGVVRVARNELVKEILRDYGYIEHYGMGVRRRIIEAMQEHNGTEPDLLEGDDRFVVRLWKKPEALAPPEEG